MEKKYFTRTHTSNYIFGIVISILLFATSAKAQVGYQVSLLNKATGEPRANTTVNATITITDSQDGIVYTGTQRATSNDFGVLSLAVGNADTFQKVDTGKMPLFISISVDGTLIGKTQILSVPMAEVASKLKSSFTKEDLLGTWKMSYTADGITRYNAITFSSDGSFERIDKEIFINGSSYTNTYPGTYEIEGNTIFLYYHSTVTDSEDKSGCDILRWHDGKLAGAADDNTTYSK